MKRSFTTFFQPRRSEHMKGRGVRGLWIFVLMLGIYAAQAALITPPFSTKPFQTDTLGISAGNERGFFHRGTQQNLRYFLGQGGKLILDFPGIFTDGPG